MIGLLKRLFHRPSIDLDIASLSERGLVRPDNQDCLLVNRERLAFCVADGMGGGEGGAAASRIVCRYIAKAAVVRGDFAERLKHLDESFRDANSAVRDFARRAGYRQMASTATALIVDEVDARQAVIGYVGDTRVYRWRCGRLQQLTYDHTLAGEVRRAHLSKTVASDFHDRAHVFAHVLTRAIGVADEVCPEWRRVNMRPGDKYLVCSDGVHDMLSFADIESVLARPSRARETVSELASKIVAAGAADNYSMIVVGIGGSR